MTQPTPGWFPDPSDPSRQRYFDGRAWTEDYAPFGAPATRNSPPSKSGMSRGGKIGLWLVGAVVLLIAIGSLDNSHRISSTSSGAAGATSTYAFAPTAVQASPTPTDNFTPGQDNAITKAEIYLSMGGFSEQGLIQQLQIGDDFSKADATFAVQHLEATGDVNWNAEALKKARQYLNMTGFSLDGLIQQLEVGDNFTPSQAQYGAHTAYAG